MLGSPRALYDWYNHRFILAIYDSDGASNSWYDIAVSQSDNPNGGWYINRIQTPSRSGVLISLPRLGQDHTATYPISAGTEYPGAIYLASDLYSFSNGFVGEEWLILPKSALYNNLRYDFEFFNDLTNPDGTIAMTSQPANVWSPYDIPRAEYFLESYFAGSNKLVAWAVSNPFGFASGGPAPVLSAVQFNTAIAYSVPPNTPQLGGSALINTGYSSIYGEVTYNSGLLHAALTSGNGGSGSQIIVYKVRPTLNANDGSRCTDNYSNACPQITSAQLLDESALNYGADIYAFFPTPQPDMEGNVTTVFSFADGDIYVSLGYDEQRVSQGASFVDGGQIALQSSAGYYSQQNWGYYNAVAPAGVGYTASSVGRPGVGWAGMYAGAGNCAGSGCWGTSIGNDMYTQPNKN
jgi:hypothetical protein